MSDPRQTPDDRTRTGDFYFQVRRRDGEAWNWQLRIEALGTGDWGTFDSMQEALWFIRQHLCVDDDGEGDEILLIGDIDRPLDGREGRGDAIGLTKAGD